MFARFVWNIMIVGLMDPNMREIHAATRTQAARLPNHVKQPTHKNINPNQDSINQQPPPKTKIPTASGRFTFRMPPAPLRLTTHLRTLFTLQLQDLRIPGVRVTPTQIGVKRTRQRDVTLVARVVQHKLTQRTETRLDRVGP